MLGAEQTEERDADRTCRRKRSVEVAGNASGRDSHLRTARYNCGCIFVDLVTLEDKLYQDTEGRTVDDGYDAEQSAAMEFLQPLLIPFHEGWHAAHGIYRSYDPAHTADHDDSTAASCVRSHMWAYVQNRIAERPGVSLLNVRGLKLVNFHDRYVLRFKQVDRSGLHQNYQTDQQNDFDKGVTLPDIPPAAIRLTSGYQLSVAADAIDRILIARVHGRSVMWLVQINVVAAEAEWSDITPARFTGTRRVQATSRRTR